MDTNRDEFNLAPLELTNFFDVSIQAINKQIKKLEIDTVTINKRNYLRPEQTRKIFEDRGFK